MTLPEVLPLVESARFRAEVKKRKFLIVVTKLFHHHGEAPRSTHQLNVPSPLFQGVSESVPKKEIKRLRNGGAEQPDILALQSVFSLNPVFIFYFVCFT